MCGQVHMEAKVGIVCLLQSLSTVFCLGSLLLKPDFAASASSVSQFSPEIPTSVA